MANASYDEAQDRMKLLPNYYRWIFNSFFKHVKGRVMELGAGAGHLMPSYIDSVKHAYALDHNPVLIEAIEKKYGSAKVTTVLADLSVDFTKMLAGEMDTVIALDVLEHFEDDVMLATRARKMLATGGYMIVKVPANSEFFGDADKASGHFRRYDPDQLSEVMRAAGLKEVSLEYFNRPGALIYRCRRNRKSNFSKTFNPAVLKCINLTIPLIAIIDRILPGKGLSLIGIYKKS